MYIFEAKYLNMEDAIEITRKIEFEEQRFTNEKDCYLYAMEKAYDMMQDNEIFCSLEFIAC